MTLKIDRISLQKIFQDFRAVGEVLLVWPFVFLFLRVWSALFVFTPTQIVELEPIPLILQGGNDWGGSNIFAAYVAGHFLFGGIACLLLTLALSVDALTKSLSRILIGFAICWLCAVSYFMILSVGIGYFDQKYRASQLFYLCDYLQVAVLFAVADAASIAWIGKLAAGRSGLAVRLLLSPIFLVLLAVFAKDGITPKAGREVAGDAIPDYRANGGIHSGVLKVHWLCTKCVGGSLDRSGVSLSSRRGSSEGRVGEGGTAGDAEDAGGRGIGVLMRRSGASSQDETDSAISTALQVLFNATLRVHTEEKSACGVGALRFIPTPPRESS